MKDINDPVFVHEIIPSLFRERGVREEFVKNIQIRLQLLSNNVSGSTGKTLNFLTDSQQDHLQGFIEGCCCMLVTVKQLTREDYDDIVATWKSHFPTKH